MSYTNSVLNLTPSTSIKLTGLDTTGWSAGKRFWLRNATTRTGSDSVLILLERNSSSSSAANRFQYPNNKILPITLMPQETAEMYFDGTDIKILKTTRMPFLDSYFDYKFDGKDTYGVWISGTGADWGYSHNFNTGYYCFYIGTGTTTTGRSSAVDNAETINIGRGAIMSMGRVYLDNLSTAGEEYDAVVGLTDITQTDIIGWIYDRQTSVNWRAVCRTSGSSTYVDSSQAVATSGQASEPILGSFINGDGTRADFFYSVDQGTTWTFTSSITTNIPSLVGFGASIIKSAGTTNRYFYPSFVGQVGWM